MIRNNFLPRLFIAFYLLTTAASSSFGQVIYPSIESNVSYSSILTLDYREADYTLSYGSDDLQFGRLWLPQEGSGQRGLLVFIHGGCWLNQFDMTHTFPATTALAQAGYAVWSLEYRRTGDIGGGWPGSYEDIKAGIEFAENLSPYGVFAGGVVIVGHSAGGHLALLTGKEFPDASATIGLAAITDIASYAAGTNSCEIAAPRFMGATYKEAPSLYREANPAVLGSHSNTLLLHGGADTIVDVSQASMPGAESKTIPDAGHFDWVHPGTKAFDLLLESLEASF